MSIHSILAAISSTPELALSGPEAKSLALATANVQRHYKLAWIKDEHLALGIFASTAFAIYKGKAQAVIARKKAEAARAGAFSPGQPGQAGARVVPITPGRPTPPGTGTPMPPPPAGFGAAVSQAEAAADWLGAGLPGSVN